MAGLLHELLRCIFGPRLRRVHRRPRHHGDTAAAAATGPGFYYQPRIVEKHSDSILGWAYVLWSVSYYTSPLLLLYFYRKGYIVMSKIIPATPYASAFLLFLTGVACLRGMSRWSNPEYVEFITILAETKKHNTEENKRRLASYSFDFDHWPMDFSWSEVTSLKGGNVPNGGVPLLKPELKYRGAGDGFVCNILRLPCQFVSYLIAKSFGRRMLYPGSVSLLQKAIMPMLIQGQTRLMEEYQGKRAKLISCDGNHIDTVFVDRRVAGTENGKKLVICCEGNAGFYEVGCVSTPLEAGYSVLGWNHPGFAGSTGVPFPQNEANAMDVVIQYAMHRLDFTPETIIMYAWSIGGFTATWATMNYPEISALVLDASFDDLVPLALKVMPETCRGLVTRTVREYLNLNNAEQLCKYQGPLVLIRRTKDEIITTVPDDITSNRGNDLLVKLLQFRYPKVMAEEGVRVVREWLSASNPLQETALYSRYEVHDDWCVSVLQSYRSEHGHIFPWTVGEDMTPEGRRQLAIFLAHKYMRNFDATHCTPLPASEFPLPWSL